MSSLIVTSETIETVSCEPDNQETMSGSPRQAPQRSKSMPTAQDQQARGRSASPSQRKERSSSQEPINRMGPTQNSKRGGRRPGKPISALGRSFRKMASGKRRPPGPQGERMPPQNQKGPPRGQGAPQGRKMGPGGESQEGAEAFSDEPSGPPGGRRNALQRNSRGGDQRSMRGYVGQSFRKVGKGVGKGVGTVARPIGNSARKVARPIAKSRVGRRVGRGVRQIVPAENCTNMKIAQYLVPIILIIVCSVGLVISSGNGSKLPSGLKGFTSAGDVEDPFAGSVVPRWENKAGKGLELTMVNALQDKWQVVFALAIADWDFGNPDALTLSTEQIDHDVECESITGKVKVCNGDYGETKWRGINLAVLNSNSGYMEASSAKMNEYYLSKGNAALMQYTMCHEMGHSLGLPHSDEDFNNKDLGNCMDYTNNYDANKHPDETNYEYMADLYGSAGRRRRRRDLSLRSRIIQGAPKHIKARIKEVVAKIEQRMDDNAHEDGWLLLHRNQHGEEHEMQVGEGYIVRVQMLLA